jgi:polyisoprenoid-binding protein YceI
MRRTPALAVLFASIGLFAAAVHAQEGLPGSAGRYAIGPQGSNISFAVQQIGGGGIVGSFANFTGEMIVDPGDIGQSRVMITIFPASVATGKARVDDFLRSEAVFNTAQEREIRFVSTRVTRTGGRTALIEGTLTARGRTPPESFNAELMDSGREAISFHVVGAIYRSPFGMDVGTPIYSNKVEFDMILRGVRR